MRAKNIAPPSVFRRTGLSRTPQKERAAGPGASVLTLPSPTAMATNITTKTTPIRVKKQPRTWLARGANAISPRTQPENNDGGT
jgi:hypothetical protein